MNSVARQSKIVEIVSSQEEASVVDLASRFQVSPMTVRRDLQVLSRARRIRRTHGGAVPSRLGAIEFVFQEDENTMAAQKRAIAQRIVSMIKPNTAVSLDTGTTTLEVARTISDIPSLTVLTSSLAIAAILHVKEEIEVVLLGGTVRTASPDLSGPMAEDNLKSFRTHMAILGADAATVDGLYTSDIGVARLSRAMIENSDQSILAIDSSKFNKTGFSRFASLSEIDVVVTDQRCSETLRERLESTTKQVIYV